VEHAAPASAAAAATSGTAGNDPDGTASPHATTATAGHVEQTNGSSRSVQHDRQTGISSSINFCIVLDSGKVNVGRNIVLCQMFYKDMFVM